MKKDKTKIKEDWSELILDSIIISGAMGYMVWIAIHHISWYLIIITIIGLILVFPILWERIKKIQKKHNETQTS